MRFFDSYTDRLLREAGNNPVEAQLKQANNPKAAAKAAFNQKWNQKLDSLAQTARDAQKQVAPTADAQSKIPCPKCGAMGFGGKKFCGQCGADMATGETAEQRAERQGGAGNTEPTQPVPSQQPAAPPKQAAPSPQPTTTGASAGKDAKLQNFGKELTAFQSMFNDLMKQFEDLKKD